MKLSQISKITPKLSLITTTFNSAATIASTLESVLSQSYADFEHIIIDNQSSDSTLHIDECVIKMRVGGTSNAKLSNIMRANLECARAWRDNGLSSFPIFVVLKPLRKILHRLVMLMGAALESSTIIVFVSSRLIDYARDVKQPKSTYSTSALAPTQGGFYAA